MRFYAIIPSEYCYIVLLLHNILNRTAIMYWIMNSVTCLICDKSFANKYRLSTHKSWYHREKQDSDESSAIQPLDSQKLTHMWLMSKWIVLIVAYSDADTIVSEKISARWF